MSSYTRKRPGLSFVVEIDGIYHHFQLTPEPSDSPEEYNDNLIRCFQNDLADSYPWPDGVNWRTIDKDGAICDWVEKPTPFTFAEQWLEPNVCPVFVGQMHVFDIDPMHAIRPVFVGEVRAASFAQWDKLIVKKPQFHDNGKA